MFCWDSCPHPSREDPVPRSILLRLCLALAFIVSNFHNFGGGVYGAHQLGPIPWPHPGGR